MQGLYLSRKRHALHSWSEGPQGGLALVLLRDQFPRQLTAMPPWGGCRAPRGWPLCRRRCQGSELECLKFIQTVQNASGVIRTG